MNNNSVVIWKYQRWLEQADGLSESTIRAKLRAIRLYEFLFEGDDFANYNSEKAIEYKDHLTNKLKSEIPMSSATFKKYLINLKMFLEWLSREKGYRSKINNNSLSYLKPSRKILAIASGPKIIDYPSLEHIIKLVNSIEGDDEISRRNRALISFTLLTGMRADSIVSLSIDCIDIEKLNVIQDPKKGVKTKFSKTIYSKIFNFDDGLLKHFSDWIKHLNDKGYGANDPVFPRSKQSRSGNNITYQAAENVIPKFWKTTASMREIFKKYAERANLKYFTPHTFRHSANKYALDYAQNAAEIKAVSQNFGHEKILTTISVYGQYSPDDLFNKLDEMIRNKKSNRDKNSRIEKIKNLVYEL